MSYYLENPLTKKKLRVSVNDYPIKFSYLTPIEEILKDAKCVQINDQGFLYPEMEQQLNLIVDGTRIRQENVDQACASMLEVVDRIYSLSLSAALIEEEGYNTFIHSVLQCGQLRYLVSLDLSYIPISYAGVQEVCKFVNPIVSGYNPLKRLNMCKCDLKVKFLPSDTCTLCREARAILYSLA